MKLKQFFEKNKTAIVIILFAMFALKSIQSCNRQNSIDVASAKIKHLEDSLNVKIENQHDSITKLNFDLELAVFSAKSAEKRADAIQSTAEKTTRNTTIQIK